MSLENPYRHGGYHFTVATLLLMGINKAHKFSAFVAKLQKVWSKADADGWKDFKNREARNEATAKDLDGRIFQNCRVLQRTKDYGKPLLKAGAVIDLTRDDKGGLADLPQYSVKTPSEAWSSPQSLQARSQTGEGQGEIEPEAVQGQEKSTEANCDGSRDDPGSF